MTNRLIYDEHESEKSKSIISNYTEDSTVIISTHLISDIEKILDEFVFIQNSNIVIQSSIYVQRKKSPLKRRLFYCGLHTEQGEKPLSFASFTIILILLLYK